MRPARRIGTARGREQRGRARRERARLRRLADELRAVTAAEAEQRRRAEQLGVAEAGLQLFERAHRVAELGAA